MLAPVTQRRPKTRMVVEPVVEPLGGLRESPQRNQQKRCRWQAGNKNANKTKSHCYPTQRKQKWARQAARRGNIFVGGVVIHGNRTIFGVSAE